MFLTALTRIDSEQALSRRSDASIWRSAYSIARQGFGRYAATVASLNGARIAERRRRRELQARLDGIERERSRKFRQAKLQADFVAELIRQHVSSEECDAVHTLVAKAVAAGHDRALIYCFPATGCLDAGRAIDENLPNWRATLKDKVGEICRSAADSGRHRGYRITPVIINRIDGLPADIGLFLCWDTADNTFETMN